MVWLCKTKISWKNQICYLDTDSLILYIKTDYICKDIAEDAETRFDTSNYELDRSLPEGKSEKVIGLVGLGAETYRGYLIDDSSEKKKAKGTKKHVIMS